MEIRRMVVVKDQIFAEGGVPRNVPGNRVAACAVIRNPLSEVAMDDLSCLVPLGIQLGEILVSEAMKCFTSSPISYGKAAIVGTGGEIEHAAAIIHPKMGRPVRDALGGGKAIIPSNVKVAAPGVAIDVPIGNKNDVWSFDEIDTMTVAVPDAPRHNEIVAILVLADCGRPRPRIPK